MGQCLIKFVQRISGGPMDLTGSMVDIRAGFCDADPITNYGKRVSNRSDYVIAIASSRLSHRDCFIVIVSSRLRHRD